MKSSALPKRRQVVQRLPLEGVALKPAQPDLECLTYSVPEAAELLGCGPSTAWELVRSGDLPHTRIGRLVRVTRKSLEAYLEGNTTTNWVSSTQ